MKEKMEWISFEIDEREMFEEHINEMSKQGWNIVGITADYILYKEADEVKEYIIDICENPNKKDAYRIDKNVQKQIEMYEEFGYTFICNFINFLVFDSNGQERIIHTDEKVEKQLIEAAIKKYRMRFVIIPTIILIAMTLIFAIFSQEYLLYVLSSTYTLLLPILVIIVNLFPIIISNKMYKIDKNKRVELRYVTLNLYRIISIIAIGIFVGGVYNSILYPIFFIIGFTILYAFNVRNTNKRLRGEINEGNANVGYYLFLALIIFLINSSRLIINGKNPMIISENLTGKVNKVIVDENANSMFAKIVDVSLETDDRVYQYTYYDVKETFLSEFITDLVRDCYSKMEYKYDINDTKVYYVEEVINVLNSPDFSISKMALVHGDDMIVLNHEWIEDKEHLQHVIDELGW